MSTSLCCCSPCRPTYKRHVDNIFPANPDEGLVKNKMETLVYYAVTSPEKLDRIGEYLETRISRDIFRNRHGFVVIGMEAMDQLIKSCHMNTINLFVESFLKTVQKLLESPDPDLQILASQSFLQFSQIKEDTPSYHRSYNFFIERFAQMCHSEYHDNVMKNSLRLSGLNGLNGVIRKTVNEDLAENIWEPKHMEKIVPSLLYNIDIDTFAAGRETPDLVGTEGLDDELVPSKVADQILRELFSSATFSAIKAILRPVLVFIRDHNLWEEQGLAKAIHIFEAIMYSVHVDLSYLVIHKLIAHLDAQQNKNTVQKASIAIVLSNIIGIGVGDSTVGPAVLDIINELLKHLKKSVEKEKKTYDQSSSAPLQQLQHALLESLGEYSSKMPDFQKIEIMKFILGKVPIDSSSTSSNNHELQLIYMKALFCVAQTHKPTLFSTTFTPQLLTTLLRLLQAPDQDVRLLVLQTIQILVDRHNNREKLTNLVLEPATLDLEGVPNKFNRSDQMFVQKSLFSIFIHFKRVLEEQSNSIEFIEAVYSTSALLHIETATTDESAIYLLDLLDSVQNIAITNVNLSTENRFALHAVAVCFLTLLAYTVNTPELDAYVDSVIQAREAKADHMLPPLIEQYHPDLDPNTPEEDVLIKQDLVKEALKNAGKDVQRMDSLPRKSKNSPSRNSWPEPVLMTSSPSSRRESNVSSSGSISNIDLASLASSPGIMRRPFIEDTSVTAFKRVLEGPTQEYKEAEIRRKKDWQDKFSNASLEELTKLTGRPEIKDFLDDVFHKMTVNEAGEKGRLMTSSQESLSIMACQEPYEKYFPELFMY